MSKEKDDVKIIKCLVSAVLLICWFFIFFLIVNIISIIQVLILGGTTSTVINENLINMEEQSSYDKQKQQKEQAQQPSSVTYGAEAVVFDGTNWNIDLNAIPNNESIQMPNGVYQSGSTKARAELLMLAQEICSRPEICITPQQLLGFFYNESAAGLTSDSIFTHLYDSTPNGDGDVAPLFLRATAWTEASSNHRGRRFISKYDPSNTTGETQVYDYYKGEKSCDEPKINFLPDALYTVAICISDSYKGNVQEYGSNHWSNDYAEWGKNLGMSDEEIDILRFVNACGLYNSHGKWYKIFIPAMYVDLYRTYGDLTQWYTEAGNRDKIYDLLPGVTRTVDNYQNSYDGASAESMQSYDTLKYSNQIAERYTFIVLNGGRWVYEGLVANAEALQAKGYASQSSSGEYSKQATGKSAEFLEAVEFLVKTSSAEKWLYYGYGKRPMRYCTYKGKEYKVRPDCSGLPSAALRMAGIISSDHASGDFGLGNIPELSNAGYPYYKYNKSAGYSQCKLGDIVGYDGHVEIYAGNNTCWNWGCDGTATKWGVSTPGCQGLWEDHPYDTKHEKKWSGFYRMLPD